MSQYPYPGLRPFNIEENDIFFGREQQVDDLLERLSELQFLAVTGNSGCGKSSLIYAGLIPAIKGGLLTTAGLKWRFAIMRPGENPIRNLAESLSKAFEDDNEIDPKFKSASELESWLKEGPLALNEIINSVNLPENTKLLLLVDQFEEIFRYSETINSDEAEAFVSLLLSTIKYTNPVYTIITMRSDFIGDCSKFLGLPEAINEGQYLTPRLTREQLHEAIVEPAELFDTEIEPALVNRILNEMGSDPDQLPLMQHALMYMWMRKNEGIAPDFGTKSGPINLTLKDYEEIGGISNALTNHANEAYNNLTEDQKVIAKTMFQGLAERTNDNLYIRRPSKVNTILSLTDSSLSELTEVVDAFRRSSCNFLLPPIDVKISEETIIDISHESLIRKWSLLHEWVDREAEYINTYRRLEESATLWEKGEAAPYRPPDLNVALRWRERRAKPEWAQQYGNKYNLVLLFISESSDEYRRSEWWRRARSYLLGFASCIVLVSLIVTYFFYKQSDDESKRSSIMKIQHDINVAETAADPMLRDTLVWLAVEELEELGDLDETTKNSNEFNKRIQILVGNSLFPTRQTKVFGGFNNRITTAAFSPGDKKVAVSSLDKKNQVNIWKKSDSDDKWEPISVTKDISGVEYNLITDISFLNNGDELAISREGGNVEIWDINSNKLRLSLERKYIINRETIESLKKNFVKSDNRSIVDKYISGSEILLKSKENKLGFDSEESIINRLIDIISENNDNVDPEQIRNEIYELRSDIQNVTIATVIASNLGYIGHPGIINAIDINGDKLLASAGPDGKAIIWDISDQNIDKRQLKVLYGHDNHVEDVKFSNNAKMLATSGEDGKVLLWDTNDGKLLKTLGNKYFITDESIDIVRNNIHNSREDNKDILDALDKLNSDSQNKIGFNYQQLREKIKSQINRELSFNEESLIFDNLRNVGHESSIKSIAFNSEDNKLASVGLDQRIIIWDIEEENPHVTAKILNGHKHFIYSVDFYGEDLIATGSHDGTVKIWNINEKQPIFTINNYRTAQSNKKEPISSVEFSTEGKFLITGSFDSTAKIWDLDPQYMGIDDIELEYKPASNQNENTIPLQLPIFQALDFNFDNSLVATSTTDGFLVIWDLNNISEGPVVKKAHKDQIYEIAFSSKDNYLLTAGWDKKAKLWKIDNADNNLVIEDSNTEVSHNEKIMDVEFNHDGSIFATASWDKTVRLWDIDGNPLAVGWDSNNYYPIYQLSNHKDAVYNVEFNNDSTRLLTTGIDQKAVVWTISKEPLKIDKFHDILGDEAVYGGAFLNVGEQEKDDLIVTTTRNGTIRIWEKDTGEPISTYSNKEGGYVAKLDVSDTKELIIFSDESNKITILDYEGHKVDELDLSNLNSPINDIALSSDGNKLGIAYSNKILIKSIGNQIDPDKLNYEIVQNNIEDGLEYLESIELFCEQNWKKLSVCHPFYLIKKAVYALYDEDQDKDQMQKLLNHALSSYKNDKNLQQNHGEDAFIIYRLIHDKFENFDRDKNLEMIKQERADKLYTISKMLEALGLYEDSQFYFDKSSILNKTLKDNNYDSTYYETRISNLLDQVALLAYQRKVDKARELFPDIENVAHKMSHPVPTNLLSAYVNRIMIYSLLDEGKKDAYLGKIDIALSLFNRADEIEQENVLLSQEMDIEIAAGITASDYNYLCWFGSLYDSANDVLFACDKAVEKAEDDYNKMISKDSRALAYLILANDPNNSDNKEDYMNIAADDLRDYISFMSSNTFEDQINLVPTRSKWLADIKDGVNPITPDVIEQLKTEGEQTDVQIQQAY